MLRCGQAVFVGRHSCAGRVVTWDGAPLAEQCFGLLAKPPVLVAEPGDLGSQGVGAGVLGVPACPQLGGEPLTGASRRLAEAVDLGAQIVVAVDE